MTQVTTKAGLAELNAPGVGDYYEAHVDHVREVFAAIEAEVRAEIAAQVRALPTWANEDWRDDVLGESEHHDIETVDRAAVLALLEADSRQESAAHVVTPEASVGERLRVQTPAERDIRDRHRVDHTVSGLSWCPHDQAPQPCDTQVVLGILDALAATPAASDGSLDVLAAKIAKDWNGRIDVERLARALRVARVTGINADYGGWARLIAAEYARSSDVQDTTEAKDG